MSRVPGAHITIFAHMPQQSFAFFCLSQALELWFVSARSRKQLAEHDNQFNSVIKTVLYHTDGRGIRKDYFGKCNLGPMLSTKLLTNFCWKMLKFIRLLNFNTIICMFMDLNIVHNSVEIET